MAVVGDQLLTRVFGHSKAEQVFRTWWDTIEDYMVYSLVTIGIIVMPTAMVIKMPLHCNFVGNRDIVYHENDDADKDYTLGQNNDTDIDYKLDQNNNMNMHHNLDLNNDTDIDYTQDPRFHLWWVRKACLFNGSVSPFLLYLPYIVLIMALVLYAIERVFSKAFKAGLKLEKLYKLLLHREVLDEVLEDETDGKEITEAKETFKGSKSYYMRFLIKYRYQTELFLS